MSIIHDALKKVQHNKPPEGPVSPRTPEPGADRAAPGSEQGDVPPSRVTVALLTALGVVVIMIILVLIHLALATTRPGNATPPPPVLVAKPAPEQAGSTAASDPVLTTDPFHIEGIMDSGGKKVVLINGRIYEEGEVFSGMIIETISMAGVIVNDHGRRRVISTPR